MAQLRDCESEYSVVVDFDNPEKRIIRLRWVDRSGTALNQIVYHNMHEPEARELCALLNKHKAKYYQEV